MSAAPAAAPAGAPKPKKNMGMILQIAFAAINLSAMGYGSFLVYASTIGWTNPSITEEASEKVMAAESEGESMGPLVFTMDKFTVNLGGEPKRTILLEVNLEMLGKDGFEEVMTSDSRAKARDRIVRLLNDQSFSDLESIQGKLFLKDKIAYEVNSVLHTGVVKDVFFSNFLVQ